MPKLTVTIARNIPNSSQIIALIGQKLASQSNAMHNTTMSFVFDSEEDMLKAAVNVVNAKLDFNVTFNPPLKKKQAKVESSKKTKPIKKSTKAEPKKNAWINNDGRVAEIIEQDNKKTKYRYVDTKAQATTTTKKFNERFNQE